LKRDNKYKILLPIFTTQLKSGIFIQENAEKSPCLLSSCNIQKKITTLKKMFFLISFINLEPCFLNIGNKTTCPRLYKHIHVVKSPKEKNSVNNTKASHQKKLHCLIPNEQSLSPIGRYFMAFSRQYQTDIWIYPLNIVYWY